MTFRLTPQVAMFQRCCIASASDEGRDAAELGLPPSANHYCLGSAEWKAWRDSYTRTLLDAGKLDVAERELDAGDVQAEPWWPDAILWALIAVIPLTCAACIAARLWIR